MENYIIDSWPAIIVLYLVLQVGLSTMLRMFSRISEIDGDKYFPNKVQYINLMIPVFGILYALFHLFKFTLSSPKKKL